MRSGDEPASIDMKLILSATPAGVFRALTSQTELRRWWAPRVIMSRHIVSFDDGRDIEMKLQHSEKNHLVRYSWRDLSAEKSAPTVITFQIKDLGVSRGRTGEGISLEMTHDGWRDARVRDEQEKIWKLAMPCLKAHLEGKKFTSWWLTSKGGGGFKPVKASLIRAQIDKLDKENRVRGGKKQPGAVLWKICQGLDTKGTWHMKETGEFEFRSGTLRLFSVNKTAQIVLNWKDMAKVLGDRMAELAGRLAVEQDLTLSLSSGIDRIPAIAIDAALWVKWCIDAVEEAGNRA